MHFSRGWALAGAVVAMIPAVAVAQAADPVARIAAYDDAVIGVAKAKLGIAARVQRFEPVVRAHYDMPAISALVVGASWASAPAADKTAAIAALTHHSAVSLARNFDSYDGTKFIVDPKPIERAGSQIVKVTIGDDVLFYRMRQSGGTWRILDVISGGVSQLALQRADLAGTVRTGGIAAMVKRLGQLDAVK